MSTHHRWMAGLFPLIVTAAAYTAAAWINARFLDLDLRYFGPPLRYWSLSVPSLNVNASLLPDFLIQVALGYVLASVLRRRSAFVAVHVSQILFIYVGNGVKISFFGEPWVVTDWFLVREMLGVLPPLWNFVAAAVAISFAWLLVANLRVSVRRFLLLSAMVIPLLGAVTVAPERINTWLQHLYGHERWAPIANFKARGATLYLLDEVIRFSRSVTPPPSASDVQAALVELDVRANPAPGPGPRRRNVHVIAAESLWNPSLLTNYRFSTAPWSEEFTALWAGTSNSTVMSPVFGGGTANAEYEALCGYIAATPVMMFQTEVRNATVPCLPQVLRNAGYFTIASHPNRAGFWNRNSAYPRIGFQEFHSIDAFEQDDLRGPYLSDASTLAQNARFLASAGIDAPVFNYIMTIAAHWPYKPAEGAAPLIDVRPDDPLLQAYANSVHDSSRALADHVRHLRMTDPDALIVIFGDHLPLLGPDLGSYHRGGFLPGSLREFSPGDAMRYTSAPLIVIDGRNGPQRVGNIAMYELPRLLLRMLGWPGAVTAFPSAPRGVDSVRPVQGVGTLIVREGKPSLCRPTRDDRVCKQVQRWVLGMHTVARDLNSGHQHARSFGQESSLTVAQPRTGE